MSKLTEEIKKLSRKLDDIDRRVELIEDNQPKITVKVSTGCDSSVSTSNPKFKVGDKFIPHKPKELWKGRTYWDSKMDRYDGETLTVAEITRMGNLKIDIDGDYGWCFNPSWCTKVEEPKFKKGDWVRSLITGTIGKVEAFYEEGHLLSTIDGEKFTSKANNLEPYFPKEGEYFYAKNKSATSEFISIYDFTEDNNGEQYIYIKACLSLASNNCYIGEISEGKSSILIKNAMNILPATAKEKALLDSELAKRGLKFDGKEIVNDNTPKVGDFCIFWGEIPEKAFCDILYEIHNSIYPFRRDNFWYKNCVKFESEEQFRKIKEGKI